MAGTDSLQEVQGTVRRSLFPIALLSVCFNITLLTIPIYMLQVYDRVLTSRNPTTLVMLTLVAVVLVVGGAALYHYRAQAVLRLGLYVQRQLSVPTVVAALRRRFKDRIGSLDEFSEFIAGPGLVGLFDIPWAIIFIGCIYLLHFWLGVAATVAALVLILVGYLEDRWSAEKKLESVRQQAAADRFLNHSLGQSDVVGAMGMGGGIANHWHMRRQAAANLRVQAADFQSRTYAVKSIVRQFAQIAMLGLGAFLAIQDVVSAGAIVAATIICSRALAHADQLLKTWRGFRTALQAYATLTSMIGNGHRPDEPGAPGYFVTNGALCVDQASAIGSGGTPLEGIDLSLKAGESLGIIGPSEAEKSLMARLLVGDLETSSGRVLLDGVNLHLLSEDDRRKLIGYAPKTEPLFEGSIADNIARFGDIRWDAVARAAHRAGIHDKVLALPDGYNTVLEYRTMHSASPMARGIALARALYGEPVLIVLEDIDAKLGPHGSNVILEMIRTCHENGQTLVMISDRPSIVQALDWVAVLVEGQIQRIDRPQQLRQGSTLLKRELAELANPS